MTASWLKQDESSAWEGKNTWCSFHLCLGAFNLLQPKTFGVPVPTGRGDCLAFTFCLGRKLCSDGSLSCGGCFPASSCDVGPRSRGDLWLCCSVSPSSAPCSGSQLGLPPYDPLQDFGSDFTGLSHCSNCFC